MLQWTRPYARRALLAAVLATVTITAADAATHHRLAVTQSAGGGSGGATTFLQTTTSGGAVQGQVGGSAYTGLPYPFGLFGFYDGPSKTFGIGTIGISSTGYGVAGASMSVNPSILAYGEGTGSALEAVTTMSSNTSPAIYTAQNNNQYADGIDAVIDGNSNTGNFAISGDDEGNAGNANGGVLGISQFSNGVKGFLQSNETDGAPYGAAGVYGESTGNSAGYGVAATSDVGTGATAFSAGGFAVQGSSQTNTGLMAEQKLEASPAPTVNSQNGVHADAVSGAGAYAMSVQDPAIVAEMGCNMTITTPTENGQSCEGLFLQLDGTKGYAISVYEPNSTQSCPLPTYPFSVDSDGNILQCGTTMTAKIYQRNSNPASDVETYAAEQTEATVEDYGTAQLVSGTATVALAPDFKATMDAASPYTVMTMPHGESNDLYLASQNANGFVIRESEGGHSTVTFDYRIVARPYGRRAARLPHESEIVAHRPIDASPEKKTYAQIIAAVNARNRARFPANNALSMAKQLAKRHRYAAPPIPAAFASTLLRIKTPTTQ